MGGSGRSRNGVGRKISCEDIEFLTTINSAKHLDVLSNGEILGMFRNTNHEVEFRTMKGVIVGVLFSQQLLKIINCMAKGFEYSAIVEDLHEEVCRVKVFCSKKV
jgi:hypothetical protein